MSRSGLPSLPPDTDRHTGILITCIIDTSLAIVVVALRMTTRIGLIRRLGWDDWTILCALAGHIVGLGFVATEVHYGFGRHRVYIGEWQYAEFLKFSYGEWIQTFQTLMFTKISICCLLLRIPIERYFLRPLQGAIVFLVVTNIILTFLWIFQCNPIRGAWNKQTEATCFTDAQLQRIIISQAIISIISDVVLALSPLLILWKVQIEVRVKAGLCVLMSLGIIVTVALQRAARVTNWQWRSWEVTIGIIAASIPTLRPGYRKLVSQISSYMSRRSSRKPSTNALSGLDQPSKSGSFLPASSSTKRLLNRPERSYNPALENAAHIDLIKTGRAHSHEVDEDGFAMQFLPSDKKAQHQGIRKTTSFGVKDRSAADSQRSFDSANLESGRGRTFFVMDIHRCRFVPYPPSAINALAFSHSSSHAPTSKAPPTLRLAIGRANGDIEIWNPLRGAWHQEIIFRGGKDRSVEGLVWTQDPEEEDRDGFKSPGKLRLFSIGYSDAVTEWDLASGRPLRHASSNYGELWCMAAQPKIPSAAKVDTKTINGVELGTALYQTLAVGCADGSLVLMSTADSDLQFQKTLTRPPKKKARLLSIAWQNRSVVIAGHADSVIRVFDTRNGQQIRAMSLGAGPQGGPKEILVWSVKATADGTIISGDSTGAVCFWDGRTYSRLQRITSHKADILDLAVSADGETIFSGGMDRQTTVYRRGAGSRPDEKKRWAEIAHQRFHSHDVKAMAVFEASNISILASGGLDTTPIIIPIREYGREHQRTLSSLPRQPPVRSVPNKGWLLSWWEREVAIWNVSRPKEVHTSLGLEEDIPHAPEKKLISKILLQGEESITDVDVLEDGSLLVVSTLSDIKIFRLRQSTLVDFTIKLRKTYLSAELAKSGARMVRFSPDGKWLLYITNTNKVHLIRITKSEGSKQSLGFLTPQITLKRLPRRKPQSKSLYGSLGAYDRSISCVSFSADSRILVVGDLAGYLDTFVLEGHEDLSQDPPATRPTDDDSSSASTSSSSEPNSDADPTLVYAQHWRRSPAAHLIPKLPSSPLISSFRPVPYSVTSGALTDGSNIHLHPTRHNPYPHAQDLPKGEDRLFIITADHQFFELSVLTGKISDWSRRNPTATLPRGFRNLRDRAMGCIWDVAAASSNDKARQRIWLYGSTWLWMFDLAQDFPKPDPEEEKEGDERHIGGPLQNKEVARTGKRRREKERLLTQSDDDDSVAKKRRRKQRDTGAGSKVLPQELHTGVGRSIRKTSGADGKDTRLVAVDCDYSDADSEEQGDEDEDISGLVQLRRGGGDKTARNDGEGVENIDDQEKEKEKSPPYWGTFKYRPILGIVPIGAEGGADDEDGESRRRRGVEVALVERPMFDVDLPGRYHGDQEWSERQDARELMG
ncbi:MAG: hypothetical protein Q9219_004031 [cf. Caloplaca sp. 3 TL-2023]